MRLGLSWDDAATVIVSTICLYLAFLLMVRVVGQRAFAGRHAPAQNYGVEWADQSGRRRHRDWRTTPEAPWGGRRSVAATATLPSAPR